MEKNRQTGRTSRIINHVVNELFSVGRCISTDHTTFEFEKLPNSQTDYFIEKVKRRMDFESNGNAKVDAKVIDVGGKKMVEFTLLK
jgi:G:T-mismatch repair DNA endonuclease (very short patch repair protein)